MRAGLASRFLGITGHRCRGAPGLIAILLFTGAGAPGLLARRAGAGHRRTAGPTAAVPRGIRERQALAVGSRAAQAYERRVEARRSQLAAPPRPSGDEPPPRTGRARPLPRSARRRSAARRAVTRWGLACAGGFGHLPVGLARDRRRRRSRAGHEQRRPGLGAARARSPRRRRRPPRAGHPPGAAPEGRDLVGRVGMKAWPPQPGFTVMQSTRSTSPATAESASAGVPGLIATAGAAAVLADGLDQAVGVGRGLGVESDVVGAGLRELVDLALGPARSSGERRARRPRLPPPVPAAQRPPAGPS